MPFGINRGGGRERERLLYVYHSWREEIRYSWRYDFVQDVRFLYFGLSKVFVIIYGGKVRGKNMVDVLCV